MEIKRGETVGIIGGTGSGKSTFVNLIPRFYDATSGQILVNGIDVRNYSLHELRGEIGIVPQKALLFTGTIALMLYTNPLMTVVVLLSAPVTFFVARFITMRSQQLFRDQARILGGLNGYVEEMIGGQKDVQAFRYEDHSFAEFTARNDKLYHAGVKSQFVSSLSNPSTRLVNNVTFSIIALIGSIMVIMSRISVGGLSSFLIYANLFAKPFNEITGVITQLQSATASA